MNGKLFYKETLQMNFRTGGGGGNEGGDEGGTGK